MELLKTLYSIYSPSTGEKKMRRFIKRWIYNNIPQAEVTTDAKGNIYVTKGSAENYPCIVAHLDQVQKTHSKDFVCIESEDVIFGYSPKNHRQEGLVADDKNGIWIALKALLKYPVMKAAFFVEEEIGCRGSAQADIAFFTDCRFVIQCDRRGNKDLITSISFTELCSDEFKKATGHELFGYTPEDGLMTDVLELKERGVVELHYWFNCNHNRKSHCLQLRQRSALSVIPTERSDEESLFAVFEISHICSK